MFVVSVMYCWYSEQLIHEGNLCSEFSVVVLYNKGKFHGTDCKLSIRICMNMCLHYLDMHILYILCTGKTLVANIVTVDGKQTIRHCECQIVVREGVVRCGKCAAHRKSLQSSVSRHPVT